MNFTSKKQENSKVKSALDYCSEGKSVSKYPLRLVYHSSTDNAGEKIKMGVSKKFQNQVDRNTSSAYYARHRISTCFSILQSHIPLCFQTKDRLSFGKINTRFS
jgi:ribonuclease P protein component